MVRIVLADDHALFREGLQLMLEQFECYRVIASAEDGHVLLQQLAEVACDLVILDLNMPQLNGLESLALIKIQYPHVRVVVLSNYDQPEFKSEVARLGANGYLLKNSSSEVLRRAIDAVMEGKTVFFEDKTAENSIDKDYFTDDFLRRYSLTRREFDIIRCIARELTTREIADQLFISEHTVMTHRKNLLRKLEVKNTAGLVKFASQHGLLN